MAGRMKNRWILSLLKRAAELTEGLRGWAPLNEAIRISYIHLVTPALGVLLNLRAPSMRIRVVSRHSVRRRQEFNVFLSDLDLTLITEVDLTARDLERHFRLYHFLKGCIPFLGELEVYTRGEWQVQRQIKEEEKAIIDFTSDLRKLRWQLDTLELSSSDYHRFKARRAIDKLRRRLGIETPTGGRDFAEISEGVAKFIDRIGLECTKSLAPITGFSDFLAWPLENAPAEFIAILPDGLKIAKRDYEAISDLRENPAIAKQLSALAAHELLLCRSKRRISPGESDPRWEALLSRLIQKYAPRDSLLHSLVRGATNEP